MGEDDFDGLADELERWADGSRLEQRAAAAAVAEPRLLREPAHADRALALLDGITASAQAAPDRREPAFRTLRQTLGYAWSVAVAAHPQRGLPMFERWAASEDQDIAWIVRENLKKAAHPPQTMIGTVPPSALHAAPVT